MIFRKRAAPGHRNTPNGPSTAPSNPPGMSKPRVAIFGTTARSRVHCHAVNPSASCTRIRAIDPVTPTAWFYGKCAACA